MKKSALSVFFLACVLTTGLWSGLASAATNIAQGKTTFASSVKNNSQTPERAVDGDYGTRWSSDHGDNEWIIVDLGERYDLSEARLNWHNAYAEDYEIQVSDDGNSWTVVKSVIDSDGGLDELSLSGQGRYVRIEGYRPGTNRGYSLSELEVYGEPVVDDTDTTTDDTDTTTDDTDTTTDDTDTTTDDTDTTTDDTDTTTDDTGTSTDDTDTSTDDTGTTTDDTDTSTDDTDTSTDNTDTSTDNLALHKTAIASSVEHDYLGPEQAIDGDPDTRWSSDFSDHNWITVDLEDRYDLSSIKLYWQNSYSKDYDIKVSDDGENWTTIKSVVDSDGGLDELDVSGQGRYVRIEGYRRATEWGHSLWELEVYGEPATEYTEPPVTNVAVSKAAFASSVENDYLGPEQAIDGDPDTRWSSDFSDHNWITVDLGSEHELVEAKLYWQNSYSKDYDIKVSSDGDNWTTVKSVIDSDGGLDEWSFSARGRYVRIEGYRRATDWGHSLWELEVYGYASDTDTTETGGDSTTDSDTDTTDSETASVEEDTQAPTVPTGLTAADVGDTWAALSWDAASDDTEVFSYELYRDGALVAELLAPTTSYTEEGLASGASYHYAVRAGDSAGNWSGLSESLQVSTTESTETVSTVDESTTVEGAVTLEWVTPDQRENGDYLELYDIGGYEIRYRNLDSSETKSIVIEDSAVTSYSFESLEGDYQFSIAVYDTNGLYSEFVDLYPI